MPNKQVKPNSILMILHWNINSMIEIVVVLDIQPLNYICLYNWFLKSLFQGKPKHRCYFSMSVIMIKSGFLIQS